MQTPSPFSSPSQPDEPTRKPEPTDDDHVADATLATPPAAEADAAPESVPDSAPASAAPDTDHPADTAPTDVIGNPLPVVAEAKPDAADKGKEKPKEKEKDKDKAKDKSGEAASATGKAKAAKEKLPPVSLLVEEACATIEELFRTKLSRKLVFHDLDHTRRVTKAARRLAFDEKLSAADTEALLVAAWFHDAGYTERYDGHEAASVELVTKFLRGHNYPADRLALVRSMIESTAVGAPSAGRLADLLVDADRSGMAQDSFAAEGELLRLEWEMFLQDRTFTNAEWLQYQYEYLEGTNFRTATARQRYGPGREANRAELEKQITKLRKKEKKKEKEQRETLAQPKRGIETMFHNIYGTHTGLSQMADQKANMMIQLNTLLLSALITYLAARTTTAGIAMLQNPIVMVPGTLLLFTALGSVVTAILSAQPEITSFRFNDKVKPTANRRINLLFFGNFTKLPLEDFQEGMRDLMRQKDALYINMITDIYYLGDVLSKKYRLLKVSYTIFMVGIIMTVFSFLIAVLYKGHL